jgi:hypothetical protein
VLSKSDLLSLRQCSRKLWLEHREPNSAAEPDSATRRRLIDGIEVGKQARAKLEDPLWPLEEEDKAMAAARALESLGGAPHRSAVEFPLQHAGLYARIDTLRWTVSGYVIAEAKASTFPLRADKETPGQPEEHHLTDLAIQTWLALENELPVRGAELDLLNNRWRYPGGGDYRGLFRAYDATGKIQTLIAKVPNWLLEAQAVLAGELPSVTRGKQCSSPYACPFYDHCGTLEPPAESEPIELLPDAGGKALARRLRATRGYASLLDPDPGELEGPNSTLYRRVQAVHRSGEAILESGAADRLQSLPFPRYYFDFEGIDLAVPRWSGVRPFEQIPFQWSCHIERAAGVFEHAEFLDLSGEDPSTGCISQMLATIDPEDQGPILVYSETYERSVLRGLAERHPQHAAALHGYIDRLVDLLPIVRDNFYDPKMRGSFSIKRILPVIAADLDYSQLEDVADGTGAQLAYLAAALSLPSPAENPGKLAAQLRTYCCQDTWAMVELAYFLSRAPRPTQPG